MKLFFTSAALAFALVSLFSGCDSLSSATDSIREKIAARDEPRVRDYSAPPRAVYEAVRVAAGQLGFRYVRGGPAQGEFEAVSGVGKGDVPNSARQVTMKVRIHEAGESGSEVTVGLKEVIEADSANHAGTATETPLRDTPLYDSFLRAIQQALDARGDPKK
jgi:hypothetical protein